MGVLRLAELLTSIIGQNDFPFPKSLYAVKECIEACTYKKDAVIVDFFAGSGTTGHAVLELNKEDEGQRQVILCTNNENNICIDITYPRVKRVIKGYKMLMERKSRRSAATSIITAPRLSPPRRQMRTKKCSRSVLSKCSACAKHIRVCARKFRLEIV